MTDAGRFSCTETLRNGLAVTIRAVRPDDRERLAAAFRLLDRDSIYTRFFGYFDLTEAGLDRAVSVDPDREVALVVTIGSGADEIVIGSGRYVASGPPGTERTAEVAFLVEEDYHGLGIASRLLSHLAKFARERGIAALEAEVLAENRPMLSVFARSGLPLQQRRDGGDVHVTLDLKSPSSP